MQSCCMRHWLGRQLDTILSDVKSCQLSLIFFLCPYSMDSSSIICYTYLSEGYIATYSILMKYVSEYILEVVDGNSA